MNENIEQRIIKTVAETVRVEESSISPESKFVDDLGADSLDLVELMMAFEAAFNCDIPDEEANKIVTVANAISYVQDNIKS
jgi:acyl carrier protein